FASHEVASFWLLHTVNASLAPLRHHLLARTVHPEQLYLEFSRLAGALCTFALNSHPRSLPLYDHDDLGACFGVLERQIRAQLEVVIPSSYLRIPLERQVLEDVQVLVGAITDERCFGRSRWILGVRSTMTNAALSSSVPVALKVCGASAVSWLVKKARVGLQLEHLGVPPAAIAPRS